VGSLLTGHIGKVSIAGKYTPFASDPAVFASVGIKYDARRNWVWAAICDNGLSTKSSASTRGKTAAIVAFDASTGKKKRFIDLAHLVDGGHCANDMTFDPEGNIYVTDSFAPVVYVVDKKFEPRVLVKSDKFTGPKINLNGIVYHPDGFLLVGKHNTGELFRVTLKPQIEVQSVALSSNVPGADGIELLDSNSIVVAQNARHDRAVRLVTSDGWQSAVFEEIAKSQVTFPTALTRRGKDIYMLSTRLETLFDPAAVKVSEFILQKLP
jgi:sugar lactone lactonase YvrE